MVPTRTWPITLEDKIFLQLYLIFDILQKQGGVPTNESKESNLSYLAFGFTTSFEWKVTLQKQERKVDYV